MRRIIYSYIAKLLGIDSGLHYFRGIRNVAEFQFVNMLSVVLLCGKSNFKFSLS